MQGYIDNKFCVAANFFFKLLHFCKLCNVMISEKWKFINELVPNSQEYHLVK